jgi:hypothetical protein
LVSFGGPPFPASLLEVPDGSETVDDGPSGALRTVLSDARAVTALPQQGWRRLYADDRQAAFAAPEGLGWATVVVSRGADGSWGYLGLSRGGPPRRFREGAGPAIWRFDPAHPEPTEDSTSVAVLVTELACTSGRRCDDRLLAPEIEVRSDTIDITFFARSLPRGSYRCPGNPPCALEVELPEPLGKRQLRDGCTSPARHPNDPWL